MRIRIAGDKTANLIIFKFHISERPHYAFGKDLTSEKFV
jgi:hypothetical protein